MSADNGWQPIETAPKDGTIMLARIPNYGDDNVIAWAAGFLAESGDDCGGWVHMGDGDPPECWTDGVCWQCNANMAASVPPTHWRPYRSPVDVEETARALHRAYVEEMNRRYSPTVSDTKEIMIRLVSAALMAQRSLQREKDAKIAESIAAAIRES